MKFNVASKALYATLAGVSKVINSKNSITILDNFLWEVEDNMLKITASDTENTLSATLPISDVDGEGSFCVNARRICDIAKELPDIDAKITVDENTHAMQIEFPGGVFDMMTLEGIESPRTIEEENPEQTTTIEISGSALVHGIENTIFAAGTDEIRPQMMGILWDIHPEGITFVTTDTRRLVKYVDNNYAPGITASFIFPIKPAVILKALVGKEEKVTICISTHSAVFSTENLTLNCRFIKGKYPDYNRVIPKSNPYEVIVDRAAALTALRRVSVCTDPSHGLVKFRFANDKMYLKVDDPNMNTFAHEEVPCAFSSDHEIVIGFNANYLIEIFTTLSTDNVVICLADSSRPGLFQPDENPANTELVMLLMPMGIQEF